jgi:hypothetical protein
MEKLGVMTLILRTTGEPIACATLGRDPSAEVQKLLQTYKTNVLDEALQTVKLSRPIEEKDLRQHEVRALVDDLSWRAIGPCLKAGFFAWHAKLPPGPIRAALKRSHVTTEAIGVATNTRRQYVAWVALAASIYRSEDPRTLSSMVHECLTWIPNAVPNHGDEDYEDEVVEVQPSSWAPSGSGAPSSTWAPSGVAPSSWGQGHSPDEQRRLARGALAQWDSQWAPQVRAQPARSLQPAPPKVPPSLDDITRHYGNDVPEHVRAAALTHAWRNTANSAAAGAYVSAASMEMDAPHTVRAEPARPVAPVPKWPPSGPSSVPHVIAEDEDEKEFSDEGAFHELWDEDEKEWSDEGAFHEPEQEPDDKLVDCAGYQQSSGEGKAGKGKAGNKAGNKGKEKMVICLASFKKGKATAGKPAKAQQKTVIGLAPPRV